jgi:hypothetical protein
MGGDDGKRHDDPWEIHLAKNVYVVAECIGCASKAVVEKIPKHNAGKIK